MSFLALVMRCIARNYLVRGVFDLWKTVPTFAEVRTRHAEHWKMRRTQYGLSWKQERCGETVAKTIRPAGRTDGPISQPSLQTDLLRTNRGQLRYLSVNGD